MKKNRPKSRRRKRKATLRKGARLRVSRKRLSMPKRKGHSRSNNAHLVRGSQTIERSSSARERSLHALNDMRHGASVSEAARANSVTIRTIKKYVGTALIQERPGGRIRPTKSDRFVRYLQIPSPTGLVEIKAHGSKEATEVARYKAAVNRFLDGDLKALDQWRGKKIAGIELVTDRQTLKGLAQKELLPYSLYRSLSGGAA
jgi:hypothetical protein